MNDTPETDDEWNRIAYYDHPHFEQGIADFARKLERERDKWKKAHDNQVKLKQIISDRPDLKERAKLVAELIEERDKLREKVWELTLTTLLQENRIIGYND